jgi:uncharacterized protein
MLIDPPQPLFLPQIIANHRFRNMRTLALRPQTLAMRLQQPRLREQRACHRLHAFIKVQAAFRQHPQIGAYGSFPRQIFQQIQRLFKVRQAFVQNRTQQRQPVTEMHIERTVRAPRIACNFPRGCPSQSLRPEHPFCRFQDLSPLIHTLLRCSSSLKQFIICPSAALTHAKIEFVNIAEFSLLVWAGSIAAGLLGALTGLGGGVVIVPLLTLGFGVDIRYAMGASLVSVIATSSGAAAAFIREGYSNVRVGMFLEVATCLGALAGAFLATHIPTAAIAVVFGVVLLYSAYLSFTAHDHPIDLVDPPDPWAARLRLDSTMPTLNGLRQYRVHNIGGGFALMSVAGALSGLLGIGSGAIKVLAMDRVMRLPFKVSTTTSNFMIGVTAAASAGVYLGKGFIDPGLAMPVMLGVLAGSLVGARVLTRTRNRTLRLVFSIVIGTLALQMIYKGFAGKL